MSTRVESVMAKALGLAANASTQDVDEAIRATRFHAYLNGKLGLPIDASGDDLLAKVDERLAAKAKAAEAPRLAATPPASPPAPAASRPAAPVVDRDGLTADESAVIDLAAQGHYTTSNGRVVGEPSSPEQSSAWREGSAQ